MDQPHHPHYIEARLNIYMSITFRDPSQPRSLMKNMSRLAITTLAGNIVYSIRHTFFGLETADPTFSFPPLSSQGVMVCPFLLVFFTFGQSRAHLKSPLPTKSRRLAAAREDTSRDLGDVVVPPCCVPFCSLEKIYRRPSGVSSCGRGPCHVFL